MKLSNLKRILREDFPEDQRDFADKLGSILNPFLEQLAQGFNKNISMENLSREIITFEVENDSSGSLKTTTQFKFSLPGRVLGLNVINTENLTNSTTYPTTAPFVCWTISGNIITVKKVLGIPANNKFRITIELIS